MAIIRLDCNLNGGDSVTPNNELFYRIYGDVDNYAAPIWTTGTALSDANVTVDDDRVIITGVDGTTNTTFKIAAVDLAGNEGVLSDGEGNIVLFEDDFAGTVIDTVDKWSLVNPDSSQVHITQNDMLILEGDGTSATGAWDNYVVTQQSFLYSSIVAVTFDIKSIGSAFLNQIGVGITKDLVSDNANFWRLQRGSQVPYGLLANINSTTTEVEVDMLNSFKTLKIVFDATGMNTYFWDGASWIDRGRTDASFTDGQVNAFIATGDKTDAAGPIQIQNFKVTSADFSTQRP